MSVDPNACLKGIGVPGACWHCGEKPRELQTTEKDVERARKDVEYHAAFITEQATEVERARNHLREREYRLRVATEKHADAVAALIDTTGRARCA